MVARTSAQVICNTKQIRIVTDNIIKLNMKLTHSNSKKAIIINGTTYIPYEICDLPNNFGFHDKEPVIELREKDAVTEWFNYKGLTYVAV